MPHQASSALLPILSNRAEVPICHLDFNRSQLSRHNVKLQLAVAKVTTGRCRSSAMLCTVQSTFDAGPTCFPNHMGLLHNYCSCITKKRMPRSNSGCAVVFWLLDQGANYRQSSWLGGQFHGLSGQAMLPTMLRGVVICSEKRRIL